MNETDISTVVPNKPAGPDPEKSPLYGGVSGAGISVPEFVLSEGLIVRETYAHVSAYQHHK